MFDLYFVINRFWTRVWGSVLKQITRETVSEGNIWASERILDEILGFCPLQYIRAPNRRPFTGEF